MDYFIPFNQIFLYFTIWSTIFYNLILRLREFVFQLSFLLLFPMVEEGFISWLLPDSSRIEKTSYLLQILFTRRYITIWILFYVIIIICKLFYFFTTFIIFVLQASYSLSWKRNMVVWVGIRPTFFVMWSTYLWYHMIIQNNEKSSLQLLVRFKNDLR